MNDRSLALKFWEGLNSELREIMIMMKIDPEINDINDVVYKVEQAEKSRDERIVERNRRTEDDKQGPKREWTWFKNRTGGNRHYQPGERDNKALSDESDEVQVNAMSPQSDSEPLDNPSMNKTGGCQPQSGPHQKRISREQMNVLRAKGKCFNCRERGHKQWNCLELNSMKPPKPAIKAGAMSFIKMEELAEHKARADIYIGSIGIIGSNPIKEPNRIPTSVPEGGSPAIEKYNRWDWPAMNWLHA